MNTSELGPALLTKSELVDIVDYKDRRAVVWLTGDPLKQNKIVVDIVDSVNSECEGGDSESISPADKLTAMFTGANVEHTVWRCSAYNGIVIFRLLSVRGEWRNVFAVSNIGAELPAPKVSSVAGILARRAHGR